MTKEINHLTLCGCVR